MDTRENLLRQRERSASSTTRPMKMRCQQHICILSVLGLVLCTHGPQAAEPITNLWTERVRLPVGGNHWSRTAVGIHHSGPAPWTNGNCLTFTADASVLKGRGVTKANLVRWRVSNLHAENFDAITKQLQMTSVEAEVIHKTQSSQVSFNAQGGTFEQIVDQGDCIIIDSRVPRNWCRTEPCGCFSHLDASRCLRSYPDKFNLAAVETKNIERIASLIDRSKLALLGEAGVNSNLYQCVYWLARARREGQKGILDASLTRAGITNPLALDLTKTALLRNLEIAESLGCLKTRALIEMRFGKAPVVAEGAHKGKELSVARVIPKGLAPELSCMIANLELLPQGTKKKAPGLTMQQREMLKKFREAGLLTHSDE